MNGRSIIYIHIILQKESGLGKLFSGGLYVLERVKNNY